MWVGALFCAAPAAGIAQRLHPFKRTFARSVSTLAERHSSPLMEQPQQISASQRQLGSESPDWLARLPLPDMPDLGGDDWLQDFAAGPLASAAPHR